MSQPPPIPSELYTEEYFQAQLRGGELFAQTRGRLLPHKGYVILALADLAPGVRVLDLGCGRGELAMHAVLAGAEAHGVDYAAAGLRMAGELAKELEPEARARLHFYRCDAKRLPFADASFDRIVTTELTEHLHPWELEACYEECARVLRPDGHMVVHTVPNLLRYTVYYPASAMLSRLLRRPVEAPDQDPLEEPLHVNEHSPLYMWRSLRPRFHARVWARSPRHFFVQRWTDRMRRHNPINLVRCKNLWALAVPRGAGSARRLRAVLRAASAPRREIRMGGTELPALGAGWSLPEWGPPALRRVRGQAALRLAGGSDARALELDYRWLGPEEAAGEVEIGVDGAPLGRLAVADRAGTLRFEAPAGELREAQVRLVVRAPRGLGVAGARVVGAPTA